MSIWGWLISVGITGALSSLVVVQLQERAEQWDALRHKED